MPPQRKWMLGFRSGCWLHRAHLDYLTAIPRLRTVLGPSIIWASDIPKCGTILNTGSAHAGARNTFQILRNRILRVNGGTLRPLINRKQTAFSNPRPNAGIEESCFLYFITFLGKEHTVRQSTADHQDCTRSYRPPSFCLIHANDCRAARNGS